MTPKAHNGLVHYSRSGREVKETYSQAWHYWHSLTLSADPENKAYAEQLRLAMNEADAQSKVTA
jgi:hypothetical protein